MSVDSVAPECLVLSGEGCVEEWKHVLKVPTEILFLHCNQVATSVF